ncbi:hypothetical protein C9I98_10905 [Photobacterium sanctipauli]|uniref:Uncharacterized protein n=1 Tax=Photobacterium sanctipauli TaxID=1342794 RepID=A0A2T3NUI6_9GAMM|nr:hypothetical protein [Photobacterium sanctipauli]PSW19956.1 hypothetical protein C9I98_10905 [Photobacterium sanctipauli]
MKKAIVLLSALALFGCDEDDVKNTLTGKAEVFAVVSAEVESVDGYRSVEDLENDYGITLPDDFPSGTESALDSKLNSLGIDFDDTSCGVIDTTGDVCFDDGGDSVCVPDEIENIGLKLYTIDMGDVDDAYKNGFYPKLAAELLGDTYTDFDIKEDVSCSSIGL